MSLACHECGQDLRPSPTFPGREGGIIHPSVLAIAWVGSEGATEELNWTPVFVESPDNASICFACVLSKASQQAQARMRAVFEAYAAEIEYQRLKRDQKGKWVPIGEVSSTDRYQQFREKSEVIPLTACLHCHSPIPGSHRAFFTFKVIDKVRCESDLSAFGSYQWSNLEGGMTSFRLCFSCVRAYLPRTFKTLGDALRGIDSGRESGEGRVELFISPEFMKEMFGVTPN